MEYKKTAEAAVDLTGKKIADIITKHLQQNNSETMNMMKKYLNKDTYLQKKGRKLLII